MRLLAVELTRFRSRLAIVAGFLVGLVLTGIIVVSLAASTRPASEAEVTNAQQQVDQYAEGAEREVRRCRRDPENYAGPGATEADCEMFEQTVDSYLPRRPLDLATEIDGSGIAVSLLLAGIAVVVGCTFAGADWASGSMSNQLLFRPRRVPVWAAKAVALVIGTMGAAAVVLTLFWAGLLAVAASRDLPVPDGLVGDVLLSGARAVALSGAVALGAFSLTMLLRSTVGTLGLLFGYAVAGEALAASLPFDRMSQWSLAQNVVAWLQDGVDIYDPSICPPAQALCEGVYVLTSEHAVTYLAVLLLLAVVASVASFARRDVP